MREGWVSEGGRLSERGRWRREVEEIGRKQDGWEEGWWKCGRKST